MVELTPSQKGAAAEAAITAAVIQLGLTVLRPLCEGRRYDLIVDLEPELLRVQCKLARRVGGVLVVAAETCRFTPNGHIRKPHSPAEIDAIAAMRSDAWAASAYAIMPPLDMPVTYTRRRFTGVRPAMPEITARRNPTSSICFVIGRPQQ